MRSVAAVIVLYFPPADVDLNIKQCIEQVDHLFLIDNSLCATELPVEIVEHPGIVYQWNHGNLGLAHALNQAAEMALKEGCEFLLTLDQDSMVEHGFVEALLDGYASGVGKVGVVAPGEFIGLEDPDLTSGSLREAVTVWTSGSLLSLEVYKSVGPFCDDLFVDFVDHEYCLRLKAAGFDIYKVMNARLRHGYGQYCRRIKIFKKAIWITNHTPVRRYYIMRNRLTVRSWYAESFPEFFRKEQLCMLMEFLVVLLFEKQKLSKFQMMMRGIRDYRARVLGEYRG